MEIFEKKNWWDLIDELEEWYEDNYGSTVNKKKEKLRKDKYE